MEEIEFIYTAGFHDARSIWGVIEPILNKFEKTHSILSYSTKMPYSSIPSELNRRENKSLNIETNLFLFRFVIVANYEHSFLSIKIKEPYDNWWSEWVDRLILQDGFLQAWISDDKYYFWQNTNSIQTYEITGKSYAGLAIRSNGLPFPLEELEIDISNNPCLRKVCQGYVEAIGAKMWVSHSFLKRINKNIESLKNNDGIQIEEISSGIFYISCCTKLFTDSSSVNEQKRLRALLYY